MHREMSTRCFKKQDQNRLCVVVLCKQEDSADRLKLTCEGFLNQSNSEFLTTLVIWCIDCSKSLITLAHQISRSSPNSVHLIESTHSFLRSLPSSLTLALQSECTSILLCSCGAVPKVDFLALLHSKITAFGIEIPLTAVGIRIFPHEKLSNPSGDLKEGREWRLYGKEREDRAVHIFTTTLCSIGVETLRRASSHSSEFSEFGEMWWSFVIGHHLNLPIWKVNVDEVVDFSDCQLPSFPPTTTKLAAGLFNKLYSHMYDRSWPMGVSTTLYDAEKLKTVQQNTMGPLATWEKGFGGVNMMSEPASELDLAAAASYGVRVIRVGAVGDARDLDYLIDQKSTSLEDDKKHFVEVLPRLKNALCKASHCGLKVIITLTDLPGSLFHKHSPEDNTFPFWDSPALRTRAATFWGLIAESLAGMKASIMGYDLINEPYTLEDMEIGCFDDPPMAHRVTLHQFYLETLREIRKHDKETVVIIKGTWFASPQAIDSLYPLPDPNVAYGVHAYLPIQLALSRTNGVAGYPYSYPGPIPRYQKHLEDKLDITKKFLYDTLDLVRQWQLKHNIPSSRILVAEFGICREIPGASQYLEDLLSIFEEFNWRWLLFSFRDEEWDALDYELGGDIGNMLYRSASEIFMTVANHFH